MKGTVSGRFRVGIRVRVGVRVRVRCRVRFRLGLGLGIGLEYQGDRILLDPGGAKHSEEVAAFQSPIGMRTGEETCKV